MDVSFVALVTLCAPLVAPETMGAIVAAESNFRPFVIGVTSGNGHAPATYDHRTKAEAVARARDLLARGANLDLGLGQVNSANMAALGVTVEDMFDPCKNLRAASTILYQNYSAALAATPNTQEALRAALSAYNTGNYKAGLANGYVSRLQIAVTDVHALEGVRIMTPDDPPVVPQLAANRPEGAAGDDAPAIVDVTKLPAAGPRPTAVEVPAKTSPAAPSDPPAWNVYAHPNRAKTMVFRND